MTAEELALQCSRNNRKAQNLLFSTYERKVLSICLRYASSIDEAKDIQQETFIKVFQSLRSNEKITSLDSWIVRIAINTSIDYFRKQRSISKGITQLPFLTTEEPVILDQLNEIELLELIKQVPNPYRMVFNLYIIDGYTHKEIGEKLEVTESTSRSYLTRAKEFLRSMISKPKTKKGYG